VVLYYIGTVRAAAFIVDFDLTPRTSNTVGEVIMDFYFFLLMRPRLYGIRIFFEKVFEYSCSMVRI
jgi:hypothetical protein